MQKWTKSDLEESLKDFQKKELIYQWKVKSNKKEKKEFYFLNGATQNVDLDQVRQVEEADLFATVFVKKENGKIGSYAGQFYQDQSLEDQIKNSIKKCDVTEEEYWEFPIKTNTEPKDVLTSYSAFEQDFNKSTEKLCADFTQAISEERSGEFNSAELFVIKENSESVFSTGQSFNSKASKIYSEVCYSKGNKKLEEEFMITGWACHPEQFNFKEVCKNSAEFANHSLETEKPTSGKYKVLIDEDVLVHLFHDIRSQLSADRKYYKLPFINKGEEFISNFDGSAFKLSIDPTVDYGFQTGQYSGEGDLQNPCDLIKDNQVINNIVSHKMAQYLKETPTTTAGNVVVEADGLDRKDLLNSGEESVLEVLQFSGLFTNANDLTFSSEIRLAKLHNPQTGEIQFIKGGNLSGNIKDNFKSIQFSKEVITKNLLDYQTAMGYKGPRYALLSDVIVVS